MASARTSSSNSSGGLWKGAGWRARGTVRLFFHVEAFADQRDGGCGRAGLRLESLRLAAAILDRRAVDERDIGRRAAAAAKANSAVGAAAFEVIDASFVTIELDAADD
ncbi:hypothetical protein [Rhodopseudomonas sp. BR0G17]|uniref:hypothetical protein n=1 Tax=Rhodopseudomonas sp. BR0G17 TaxID=2269368 RepID=UPI0013E0D5AA|nr:hypothetical protein [Rhodopseudomonas sp. BR0G17]